MGNSMHMKGMLDLRCYVSHDVLLGQSECASRPERIRTSTESMIVMAVTSDSIKVGITMVTPSRIQNEMKKK